MEEVNIYKVNPTIRKAPLDISTKYPYLLVSSVCIYEVVGDNDSCDGDSGPTAFKNLHLTSFGFAARLERRLSLQISNTLDTSPFISRASFCLPFLFEYGVLFLFISLISRWQTSQGISTPKGFTVTQLKRAGQLPSRI